MKTGYNFFVGYTEYFVETAAKRKTRQLAKKIARKLLLPDNDSTISDILYFMQRANLEEKQTAAGRKYYRVFGDHFEMITFPDSDKFKWIVL